MNASFSQAEIAFLMDWAREDHLGFASGPGRTLFREHGGHPAVMGQLFARLSTLMGRSQFELVDGPAPTSPICWPWSTQSEFETRLHDVLPESTIHYLDELGALTASEVASAR